MTGRGRASSLVARQIDANQSVMESATVHMVNDDGLRDLIRRVDNREIGDATTDTTTVYLTGMLVDGSPFYAEDTVNIVR